MRAPDPGAWFSKMPARPCCATGLLRCFWKPWPENSPWAAHQHMQPFPVFWGKARDPLSMGLVYRLGQRRKTQQQSNQPNLLSAVALMPRGCRARLERMEDANPGLPGSRAMLS